MTSTITRSRRKSPSRQLRPAWICQGWCNRLIGNRNKAGITPPATVRHVGRGCCQSCYARLRRGEKPPGSGTPTPERDPELVPAGGSMDFVTKAACAEQPSPPDHYQAAIAWARRHCADCPVRVACKEHAVRNREIGVWGGMWHGKHDPANLLDDGGTPVLAALDAEGATTRAIRKITTKAPPGGTP